MYKEYSISDLTDLELKRYNKFKEKVKGKPVHIYFTTYDSGGIGFHILVSTDIPKVLGKYECDFGNYENITDYDLRVLEY